MAARAFVDMEDALDVGLQDFLERPLDRDAAQVHDGVAAADQRVDRRLVGQVAGHDFLAGAGCGPWRRCRTGAATAGEGLEALAQDLAQAAGGAGQQKPLAIRGVCSFMVTCLLSVVVQPETDYHEPMANLSTTPATDNPEASSPRCRACGGAPGAACAGARAAWRTTWSKTSAHRSRAQVLKPGRQAADRVRHHAGLRRQPHRGARGAVAAAGAGAGGDAPRHRHLRAARPRPGRVSASIRRTSRPRST